MCWCEHVCALLVYLCHTFPCLCSLRGVQLLHLHTHTHTQYVLLSAPWDPQLNSVHLYLRSPFLCLLQLCVFAYSPLLVYLKMHKPFMLFCQTSDKVARRKGDRKSLRTKHDLPFRWPITGDECQPEEGKICRKAISLSEPGLVPACNPRDSQMLFEHFLLPSLLLDKHTLSSLTPTVLWLYWSVLTTSDGCSINPSLWPVGAALNSPVTNRL